MSPAADPLNAALCEVRARVARGEVRLPEFAQGPPGAIAVSSGDHLFIVRPSGSCVRAIPSRNGRRIAFLDTLARAGAGLLAAVWALTALALVRGVHQMPALLLGGAAALLFVAPIFASHIITSGAVPVDDEHPLAQEAAGALHEALRQAEREAVAEADREALADAERESQARRRDRRPGPAMPHPPRQLFRNP